MLVAVLLGTLDHAVLPIKNLGRLLGVARIWAGIFGLHWVWKTFALELTLGFAGRV